LLDADGEGEGEGEGDRLVVRSHGKSASKALGRSSATAPYTASFTAF
jgi:hypothetical protein